MEVAVFEDWLKLSRATAYKLLRALRIPLLHIGDNSFFNLYTLDRVLFYLNRLSGPGFAAPGSTFKAKNKHKDPNLGHPCLEITDADLAAMQDPVFVAEWLAIGPGSTNRGATLVATLKSQKAMNKQTSVLPVVGETV